MLNCESERLVFEPIRAEHAAFLFEAMAHPLVNRHLTDAAPASVEQLAEIFSRMASGPPPRRCHERWVNFAVQMKSDRRWIGRIEATVHDGWAEVAYLFAPSHWRQGYASESLAWLHRYVAEHLGVTEFWAAVAPANQKSIAVVLRNGYRKTPLCDERRLTSYEPGDDVFRLIMPRDAVM